jgi:8-hydroxy-5-deazaflavin:NADPH oxidoreductase
MRIAVLGTGVVGRTLAAEFAMAGHSVVVGTRDPAATAQREEWESSQLRLAEFGDAARDAEVVVNATQGTASLDVLSRAGREALAGKVLLDVANPLDGSHGFPPTLTVKDTDSLAEQIQRAFPEARVVKSLNTVTAAVMVDPGAVGEGDTTMFVAGDDPAAKEVIVLLLEELGWRDVVDLDGLSSARGMEMWLPLWLRLMGAFNTARFNLKIVR